MILLKKYWWILIMAIPVISIAQTALKLNEMVICEDIQDRIPVDANNSFDKNIGRIFCFTNISNSENETQLTYVWFHDDKEMARIPVKIGGQTKRWRTWTSKQIMPVWTGEWTVRVYGADGREIGKTVFKIQ